MKTPIHQLPQKWREEANKTDKEWTLPTNRNYLLMQVAAELEAALADQWQPVITAPELEYVLATKDGRVLQARFELSNDGEMCWFRTGAKDTCEPTHWMPLPQAPTPKSHEQNHH